MKFTWNKTNEVGIGTIDRQHRHFFDIVNKILTLIEKDKTSQNALAEVVSELAGYATYHFGTEEKYFEQLGYEDAKLHIKAHDYYCERVAKLMEQIDDPNENMNELSEEIANFTTRWLSTHLLEKDKQFADWLKSQKVRF